MFEDAAGAVFANSLDIIFAPNIGDVDVVESAEVTKLTVAFRERGAERDGGLFCSKSLGENWRAFRR